MTDIPSLVDPKTSLDEREQYFLDILFDECSGDFREAMKRSGYPASHPMGELRRKLRKEISKASKDYIVSLTPKAAYSLGTVLTNPSDVGAKNVISAAKEILDRGDVNKEDTPKDTIENVVILLPAKRVDEDEE